MRTALAVATLAMVGVSSALADVPREMSNYVSLQSASPILSASGLRAGGSFATGFESAEGFVAGLIDGQMGWTTFGTDALGDPVSSLVDSVVSTLNPAMGDQHLSLSGDLGFGAPTTLGVESPLFGPFGPAEVMTLTMDMNIGATGGADYFLEIANSLTNTISARVLFRYNSEDGDPDAGDILILDPDGPNQISGGFSATGAEYSPGAYKSFSIVSTLGGGVDYYYDNTLIHSDPNGLVPFGGDTSADTILMFSDNFQFGERMDVDNIMVTPEPGSAALFIAGVAALTLRRRR